MFKASPDTSLQLVSKKDFLRVFSIVFLPMLLAAVDQTLLATATPAIVNDLGEMQLASWIMIAYLLATAASVPVYGWLGDRYNRRNMLIVALIIFTIGSITSALAQSMPMLIVGRVIQGLGGGGLMSLSQALIGEFIPPRQRARFQGYFASLFAVASIGGPVIGGFVVSFLAWQWLFWINIPLAIYAGYRLMSLPTTKSTLMKRSIDWYGLILFPIMMTTLIYWLTAGGNEFAWLSSESAIFIGSFTLLMLLFVTQQRKTQHSFLPLPLLAKKEIYIPLMSTFLFAACFFALIFFLPIYLQIGFGASASTSGLLLLPLTIGTITGSYTTGKVIARTAIPKWMPVIGMSITTIGFILLGTLAPNPKVIGALGFFCGIGLGTVMPSTQLLIQSVGGKQNLGRITSMASLSRSLGASMGTALFGTLIYALIPSFSRDSGIEFLLNSPRDGIINAFQIGFLVAAVVAFCCVINAACAPRVSLADLEKKW
ncbi:MAG: MDR family MFS transporter [Psychromonas sp.]